MLSKNLDMYLYSGQSVKKQKIKNKKKPYIMRAYRRLLTLCV